MAKQLTAQDYKKGIRYLVRVCHHKGIKVVWCKDKETRDYLGMNPQAAKILGFPLRNKHCFLIDKNMSFEDKYKVLRHELEEYCLIKGGDTYWKAHTISLDGERLVTGQGC